MFHRRGILGDNPGQPPTMIPNNFGGFEPQQWPAEPFMPQNGMMQMMPPPLMPPMIPGVIPEFRGMIGTNMENNFPSIGMFQPNVPQIGINPIGGESQNDQSQQNMSGPIEMVSMTAADGSNTQNSTTENNSEKEADVNKSNRSRSPNRSSDKRTDRKRSKWEDSHKEGSHHSDGHSRGGGDSSRDNRSKRKSRSRSRERVDKNRTDRRDRKSKWSSDNGNKNVLPAPPMMGNMLGAQGNMMPFGGGMMTNMMAQAQMDMLNNANRNPQQMPNMTAGMNMNMMGGMMMDPNLMAMGMQNHMFPGMMQQGPQNPVYFSSGVLLPPRPGAPLPERRQKPPGCRTIFVGGLPEDIEEYIIREMFQKFGTIESIRLTRKGFCHIRFQDKDSAEGLFTLNGYRLKIGDLPENEATTVLIDYALNRDDQVEYERHSKRPRKATPPRIEAYTPAALVAVGEKIKSEDEFGEVASTLVGWLERGECNKRNANSFYSMIQAANNQNRRLYNEKMQIDEEYSTFKETVKEKYIKVIAQFEQVAKILIAASHQRVWDHFSKQQRKNIETWQKMSEELLTMKEEFAATFDDEDEETGRSAKNNVPEEMYNDLKKENENLIFELEGYRNEAYLAKDEAERKFEKFKAHFIAEQALRNTHGDNKRSTVPPLPQPPLPFGGSGEKPPPPPPLPADNKVDLKGPTVKCGEARLIGVLTAFLLVHPVGATLDYLVSYVRALFPGTNQATVHHVLQKNGEVFQRSTKGIGANIEHRWSFVAFSDVTNN